MEMNRELAGLFGDCWHEGVFVPKQDKYLCECGLLLDASDMNDHEKYQSNPDYLSLVEVKHIECEGTGRYPCHKCEEEWVKGTRPESRVCTNCDPCPTCHGTGIRIISKLQQRMEELGWWIDFRNWFWMTTGGPLDTDLQALGAKVIEWRKS